VSASRQAVASERSRGTGGRPSELVALVTRLVVAQAGLTGAIGVSYSRRNWPWIVVTLMLAVTLCGLAAMLRSGSHPAWIFAVGFESVFVSLGLFRFATARFLGGTLFGLITLGVLVHPAVTRAFGGLPGSRRRALGDAQLSEFGNRPGEAFGGQAPG
jgi:hypothetical protein